MRFRHVLQLMLGLLVVGMGSLAIAQESESYQGDLVPADAAQQATSENYALFGVVGNNTGLDDYYAVSATPAPTVSESAVPASSPTSSAEPTPEPTVTSNSDSSVTALMRDALSHPLAQTTQALVVAAATVSALGLVALQLLLNAPAFSPVAQLIGTLISTGNTFRRRSAWGVVRDQSTSQPLPLVVVQVFEAERKKLLETQTTDAAGRYSFLLPAGTYFLRFTLAGYQLATESRENIYHGQQLRVPEKRVIAQDAYLVPQTNILARKGLFWTKFMDLLVRVQLPLLVIGTVLTVGITIINPITMNYLVLALYSVIWIYELYRRLTIAKSFGQILNAENRSGVGLAIIRLFDEATHRLAATRVSDETGSYNILVKRGVYQTQITHTGFEDYRDQVAVKHDGNINKNHLLKPVA